jgi:PST family polysaccharide transporter
MSDSTKNLTQRTVTGAVWSGLGRMAQQLTSLIGTAILARLLSPGTYGIIGMAALVMNFIAIFRDLGTSAAVIQRPDVSPKLLSSIFWGNILFATGTTALTALASPLIADFYREPNLQPVMMALACSFLLSGIGIVPSALLNREMAFRKIAVVEIVSALLGLSASITLALKGAGVWALVASNLVSTGTESLLYWIIARWRPTFDFELTELKTIFGFSANLSAFQIVNYFARNADNLLIGRYLGATPLGYYQLAYNLMLYPISSIGWVLSRVVYAAFSKVQGDPERMRRGYVKMAVAIATITFPMMAGLTVAAGPFVRAYLGAKWEPIVPLLTMLAPVGLLQSVISPVGNIYEATGRTDWMFRWGIGASAVTLTGFLIGLQWGVTGVAASYVITNAILIYPACAVPFRLIQLPVRDFAAALWPVLKFTLLMVLAAVAVRLLFFAAAINQPVAELVATSLAGLVTYAGLLYWRKPAFIREVARILEESLPGPLARFAAALAA